MTQAFPQNDDISIRSVHYGELEAVERCCTPSIKENGLSYSISPDNFTKPFQTYGLKRFLEMFLNGSQVFSAHAPERDSKPKGFIQISPFNRSRSTWRVDKVAIAHETKNAASVGEVEASPKKENPAPATQTLKLSANSVGSLLLRYCFETIWEARTWLLEVNVNEKDLLALYRQNGFQPLAHMTYWEINPEQIEELAEREPDLPNLLPLSNADAQLLYQLDTMSMPPLVRQVFDRHLADFKTSLIGSLLRGLKNWLSRVETVSGYVFEPQRKAAIGYFQIHLCRNGSAPHQAQLTVNPAYTWLYPELMSQMARITKEFPAQAIQLASSDYQPEREEYLERLGASRIAHTLMMSRSVWHKVRESKLGALENLQLPEVLQGLKPARKPVPSRISTFPILRKKTQTPQEPSPFSKPDGNAQPRLNLPNQTDFSDPPQEGPCC